MISDSAAFPSTLENFDHLDVHELKYQFFANIFLPVGFKENPVLYKMKDDKIVYK